MKVKYLAGGVVTASLVAAVAPPPSVADTVHPSGCFTIGNGDWSSNCWVGYDYASASDLVLGAQTAAKYFPKGRSWSSWPPAPPGSGGWWEYQYFQRDGKYGSGTHDLVSDWQSQYNSYLHPTVTVDGIVGYSTWSAMHGEVTRTAPTYTTTDYKYYTGDADQAVFAVRRTGADAGRWRVLEPGGGAWRWMGVYSGPPY